MPGKAQFLFIVCAAVSLAAVANYLVAAWIGMPKIGATYRRIGPQSGPQVFCAGSSLLQFAISWPEVSETLGQGIENWGVAGSSPNEWEVSQSLATNANLMIIGISLYDLNEYHLCDSRANLVPLTQTAQDLWHSRSSWQFAKRSLSQYPLAYLRNLFPTAGRPDPVLVGLRRKLPERLRSTAAAEDRANSLVVPQDAVMNFGDSSDKLSDWTRSKTLRRLALMRSENGGKHRFDGPKQLAFRRMVDRAQQHGRVILVVVPVAPVYAREFLTPDVDRDFENVLADAQRDFPQTLFVRLDRLPALNSDEYYRDPVHLNGVGKHIATEALLKELKQRTNLP